jgi:DNA-binding SARP family transcriptional activator/Tfp pilus assembly protein PilF
VTTLKIKLLGAPQLTVEGQAFTGLRRKNRALLFLLAAQNHSISRDYLLNFFWPDSERPLAQKVLRTTLHDLHKMLGDAIQIETEAIALAPDTYVDLSVFSSALKSSFSTLQGLEKALELYRGDFLDGFSLPDASQFDDWAAAERERYRLMAIQGLGSLSHLYESKGDLPRALEAGRRALRFDTLQEDLHRDLMRLLYKNGDRTGMIRQYETLCNLLDKELGVPPMPETRALYDELIQDVFDSSKGLHDLAQPVRLLPPMPGVDIRSPSARPGLPFAGRAAEIRAFEQFASSGKLILFEGEPGIGKTRLVEEIIQIHQTDHYRRQSAANRPALVLRGEAYELEQSLPYQPLIDILRGYLAHAELKSLLPELNLAMVHLTEIARLIPELLTQYPDIPAPEQPAYKASLWESLLQFFHALAQQWQVWLFLDDLHWADSATLAWLGYFVRRASSPACVLIATARPADETTDLTRLKQALLREGRLVHIPLAPLTPEEMQTLIATLNPAREDAFTKWLVSNAEGNPFFLKELVQYAHDSGWLAANGSLNPDKFLSAMVIPPTIQNLVESRFLRLSENARDILHLAAIIGREFDFRLLGDVTSLSETQMVDAVEELQFARLIQPVLGESYAFDHSLTLQVARQDMSPARRQLFHRKMAEALAALPSEQVNSLSGLISQHLIEAGAPARAVPYLLRAGQFAASLAAWEEAIAFYEQALQVEQDIQQRVEILLALGDARFHKGDMPQATDTLRLAVGLARSTSNLAHLERAYLELARSFFPQSRFAEAIALGRDLAQSGPSELEICAQFIWGAGLSIESARPVEAEKHLRCAEKLLNERPDYSGPITPALIQYQLAAVVGEQGKSVEAITLYRKALASVQANEANLDMLRRIMLYNNLAYHLFLIQDSTAADYAKAGIKLAQERGSLTHLPYLFSTSGEIALSQGDLDAAEAYFSEGLKLGERVAGVPVEAIAGLTANLGLVARRRGQDELAQKRLTEALGQADQVGNRHLVVRIRTWIAPLLPDEEARACLNIAQELAEEAGFQGLLEEIGNLRANLTPSVDGNLTRQGTKL